jgi:ABC-type phosphate transport system substrate-binding protein
MSLRGRVVLTTCIVALAMVAPSRAAAQYVVVVNASNPTTALSRAELASFLMGKATRWAHGAVVAPSDLLVSSRIRQAFSKAVLGQPATAVRSYWEQQQFSGRGQAPPQFASDDEVLAFVRRTPGGVGYITMTTPLQPGTRALVVLP